MAEQRAPQQGHRRHYIVFRDFGGMDTQSARQALDPKRMAWLENLQPVGPNDLLTVPGIGDPGPSIPGETIVKKFSANYNGNDFIIAFTASGAAYEVSVLTAGPLFVVTQFASAGTFSDPDLTQWQSDRVLIVDPSAGYCTWDGTLFVGPGGVSPVIAVTASGSGYTSVPTVAITGGSGSGATAIAVIEGGAVVEVVLTGPGAGYLAGDVLTVTFTGGGGAGAAATAIIWPIIDFEMHTIAVFQGRVWIAGGRNLLFTGTFGFDDTNPASAAGSTILSDADLSHEVTALRNQNNFLYIFGDSSLKQIGTIAVASSVTLFTITTLTSDQGTIFPESIESYNRLIIFANTVGVWAIFGATVEKISGPMDGVFRALDFGQRPIACLADINNVRCYLLLVRYRDPVLGVRSLFLAFQSRKWFVISQGDQIRAAVSCWINGALQTYVTSGSDITRVLVNYTREVQITLRTPLWDDNKPMLGKRGLRIGIAQSAGSTGTMLLTTDSENNTASDQYTIAFPVFWTNAAGQPVDFVNAANEPVQFLSTQGFLFQDKQFNASGIYLGGSLSGLFHSLHINGVVIEYEDAALMRSRNVR